MKMNNMQKFEDDLKYFNLSLEILTGKSGILSRFEKIVYRRLFLDVMKKMSSPPSSQSSTKTNTLPKSQNH